MLKTNLKFYLFGWPWSWFWYLGPMAQNFLAQNLCILGQKYNGPQSFYYSLFPWIFKICISFLKRLLLELFIMLYVTFLTSEIKVATYKITTIKMYLFWRTTATFSQFFPMQYICLHIYIKCGKTGSQNKLKMLLSLN